MSRGKQHHTGDRVSPARCGAVWLVVTVATAALVTTLAGWVGALPTTLRSGTAEQALVQVAGVVLLGCAGWVWLVASATVADALRHGRLVGPDSGLTRRLVAAACGAAVVVAVAGPAGAEGARSPAAGGATLAGLSLPDRATAASPARRAATPPSRITTGAPDRSTARVREGESLWSIAAARLPADATDESVDTAWRALYAANRGRIGADPDLLHPGQRLALPDPAHDRAPGESHE